MTTKQHTTGLALAIGGTVRAGTPAVTDATADSILSFKRELLSAEVEGIGRIYFYDPPSVAEVDAYNRHVRIDDNGLNLPLKGIVDGVIARVRDSKGAPLFAQADRERVLRMPRSRLMALWHAIGGPSSLQMNDATVEAAEKK